MKRGAFLIVAVGLLLELGVFLASPGSSPLLLLPLHGLIALVGVFLFRVTVGASRVSAAALIVLAVFLSLLDIRERTSSAPPATDDEIRLAVEHDAQVAGSAFQALLANERARVRALPIALLEPEMGREEAFARLEVFRDHARGNRDVNLTVYLPGGEALAWTGEPSLLGEDAPQGLPPDGILQYTQKQPLGTRLLTIWAGPPLRRLPAGQQRYAVS